MRRRINSNVIISITATIVSISALFLTGYQTILMRQQQSASVWPKLIISHAYIEDVDDHSFYHLSIRNVGIGPAIIRQVDIENNEKKFPTMDAYAQALLQKYQITDSLRFDASDLLPGDVIPQGETVHLFDVSKNRYAKFFIPRKSNFKITVSYESIYGDKWQVYFPRK